MCLQELIEGDAPLPSVAQALDGFWGQLAVALHEWRP
jgi:hypothetical protein